MSLTYREYKTDNIIAVDIETKDPNLSDKGSGVYRKDGYILGCAFSNGEVSEYYPINPEDLSFEERNKNLSYIKEQLSSGNRKIFANGLYDLDWLINYEGIKVNGKFDDVQIAEPLLNEYKSSYSLDSLSQEYLGKGKKIDLLKQYCYMNFIDFKRDPRNVLYKLPSEVVGEYASEDVKVTYDIFKLQSSKLKEQDLLEVYNLEMALYPLLLQMRKQGVKIAVDKLNLTRSVLENSQETLQKDLNKLSGFNININSSIDLERFFVKKNLPVIYNEPTENMLKKGKIKGSPSFSKQSLKRLNNPITKSILDLRHIKTLLGLFINAYPEFIIKDRIHCNFNQLRSDDYGTVSGRFSSSNPNLQQVCAKKEEDTLDEKNDLLNGQIIRTLFIPEDNCDWLKLDESQIEYRFIAHYAIGEGAETIRRRYCEDPNVDYHQELCNITGIQNRKLIKTLNFGAAYRMGIKKMCDTYGWNFEEAEKIYTLYHAKVPFISETSNRVANKAKKYGYIRTILNRKSRLPDSNKSYIMFNRLIQGSAADLMKKSMVDAYESGVFNILYPHLTVHDELDCSMPRTKEGREAANELKYIMENCIKLKVPIIAEMEIGRSWGELERIRENKDT